MRFSINLSRKMPASARLIGAPILNTAHATKTKNDNALVDIDYPVGNDKEKAGENVHDARLTWWSRYFPQCIRLSVYAMISGIALTKKPAQGGANVPGTLVAGRFFVRSDKQNWSLREKFFITTVRKKTPGAAPSDAADRC
ncbi:MAG: hypothetical protein KGM99_04870 [Burkholderiales bacterium]|nr:hypothetical protein [Burkholderiales bacterium]